jgi:hypothetical protein
MDKPAENQFLLKLPKEVREHLLNQATRVDIGVNQMLAKKDVAIENVYFPEDCVLSLVISMPDERTVEVATVGQEGVLGLSVLWGADLLPIVSIGEVQGAQGADRGVSGGGRQISGTQPQARTVYASALRAGLPRAGLQYLAFHRGTMRPMDTDDSGSGAY